MVWDKNNDRPLCKFIKGELATNDTNIISNLIELGYKHDDTNVIEAEYTIVETEPVEEKPEPKQEAKPMPNKRPAARKKR